MTDRAIRDAHWKQLIDRHQERWVDAGRCRSQARLSKTRFLMHAALGRVTPVGLHRFLTDSIQRRDHAVGFMLLLLSPRYQSWFGQSRVEASIERWEQAGRISDFEAEQLRSDLSGSEVRAYTRGFGMHLALKALGPLIVPMKFGGLAAFIASGNPWFLLPLIFTPLLRTIVTLVNWWTTRHEHIPHGEAFVMGLLPTLGSLAFPLQMFSARPHLSTFMIRDGASKLGQRVPVYGGGDSRTEIALIRSTDWVVAMMEVLSRITQHFWPVKTRTVDSQSIKSVQLKRSRWGRWIDHKTAEHMARSVEVETQIPAKMSNGVSTQKKMVS
jgi:hypothetical protein